MDHKADQELLSKPLERGDPRSFALVTKLLESLPGSRVSSPFSFVIQTLTGISVSRTEAPLHWKKILEHKRRLEYKLQRVVNIRTAVSDYYDILGVTTDCPDPLMECSPLKYDAGVGLPECFTGPGFPAAPTMPGPISGAIGSPIPEKEEPCCKCHDRLKEEISRARRYKHALSAILLTVRAREPDAEPSPLKILKALEVIDRIIKKTIRNVDFYAPYSESMLLVILPDTNKREALELAGRLETNIGKRAARMPDFSPCDLLVSFAVGQWCEIDTFSDFSRKMEAASESLPTTGSSRIVEAD